MSNTPILIEGMSAMNKNTRKSLSKLNEVHKANLAKRMQHRLEVARAKGDENLIQALEAEMKASNLQ